MPYHRTYKPEVQYPSTGKERDRETGFSYFGARYYDSDLSGLFLSVDPMSDKYPSLSPYAYCAWNPVKLMDPNGDTIINVYEKYKDISAEVAYYQALINISNDDADIKAYNDYLDYLREQKQNYYKVSFLLESFRNTNKEEYDLIDNLSFAGSPINIYVGLNSEYCDSKDGAVGSTLFVYTFNQDNRVDGISNNEMRIRIYQNGFNDGNNGIGTLANEFGDAIFAISRPDYNQETNNKGLPYLKIPTTKFSFDYEDYIISKGSIPRPNPIDY
ncbi:MAG: RHS repeat-associated core domain-containing protein [Bacteroidales bacterium]|nr:RHS repeat-associated core domain-containing protein [Bacteroidales bacterium]